MPEEITKPKFETLKFLVINWAYKRNLIKRENSLKQFAKTVSELGELGDALIKEDTIETIDAIGDTLVCLIVLSEQLGLSIESCLESAYDEIKARTGKTINGTFIKD